MADRFGYALAVIALLGLAQPSQAVEGGMGAYLPGSRDSFAGIVPAPGFYAGVDLVFSEGSVDGLSLAGLPIRADADIDLIFTKLSLTQVFDGQIWGGTPAVNINIPFVLDANLSYTAVTAPVAGVGFEDSTSGIGDITVTPMVGWHRGNLHYSAGFSIFAPTGSYKAANLSLRNREVDVLNTGKNIWSFQPVLAATHMDPATGLEQRTLRFPVISKRSLDCWSRQSRHWRRHRPTRTPLRPEADCKRYEALCAAGRVAA